MNNLITIFNNILAVLTVITTLFAFYQFIIFLINKVTGKDELRSLSLINNSKVVNNTTYFVTYFERPSNKKNTGNKTDYSTLETIFGILFLIISLLSLVLYTEIYQLAMIVLIFLTTISVTIVLATAFSVKLRNRSNEKFKHFPVIRFTLITFALILTLVKAVETILKLQQNIPDLLNATETVSFNSPSELVNPLANNTVIILKSMFTNINVGVYLFSLILLTVLIISITFGYLKPYFNVDSEIRKNRINKLLPQPIITKESTQIRFGKYFTGKFIVIIIAWVLIYISENPVKLIEFINSYQTWFAMSINNLIQN